MINKYAIALANHISGIKQGSKKGVQPVGDPRYKILEPVITKELCEVGLCLELRVKMSAADVAPKCNKTIEEAEKLLWDLSMIGVTFVNKIDGVDKYWFDTWVPGVMEMMVNNKELVAKYPQIAEAFDEYGSFRAPLTTGNVPVGKGPMRTIPIESAIDGETKSASYEEVTHYLNSSEIFSVSDCSCRTSRESQGEGCGHPKEDMCIQLGHAAEYYIRTGRGREITREEALAIIIKAEENGLVHQIPNLDGSGETHAICNCCGCGCFALRFSRMFSNTDMCRSNYVSVVDEEKCVGCGECVEACNLDALQLGKKLCSEDNIQKEEVRLPYDREWSEKDWIKDYRTNQKVVTADGTAPCKAKCPAHISVPGYIKLASQGRYNEALEVIKNENPFPAVCGRICPRSCESECTRGDIDSPVSIDEIKKFIADQDLSHETRYVPKKRHDFGNKIAVIGSGPAGLSCAYYLALDGYEVTVFEKQNVIGGMLTLGIPSFRLDKDVINAEIDVLRELGIKFETGVNVGEDVTLDELRKKGFEAFYIGIAAKKGGIGECCN